MHISKLILTTLSILSLTCDIFVGIFFTFVSISLILLKNSRLWKKNLSTITKDLSSRNMKELHLHHSRKRKRYTFTRSHHYAFFINITINKLNHKINQLLRTIKNLNQKRKSLQLQQLLGDDLSKTKISRR